MSLLVKTFLAKSTIPNAGIGCFAGEFIPAGTKIWQFNSTVDRVYTEADIERMSELEQAFLRMYCYKHHGLYWLCVDNGRFFNHSKELCNTYDPHDEYATYARRNILAGEEIFSDYGTFGDNDEDNEFNLTL